MSDSALPEAADNSDSALPEAADNSVLPAAQLRRSATWLLAAFASVGSILTAGLTLKGLIDLSLTGLIISSISFLIAMIGIGLAVSHTARILAPVFYTYQDAAADVLKPEYNEENPYLFGTRKDPKTALQHLGELPDRIVREADPDRRKRLVDDHTALREAVTKWINYRALQKLDERYKDVVPWIRRGATLTALGALGFALGLTFTGPSGEIKKREADLALKQAEYDLKLATYPNADKQRLQELNRREADLLKREAALKMSVATPTERFTFPVRGTWTPLKAIEGCQATKAKKALDVLVLGIEPAAVVLDSGLPGTAQFARVVTLDPGCPGLSQSVRAKDGKLSIPTGEYTLK